ncbi:MAG: multi-sensor hybrid histidine kinase [Verrucomicrobia bacterium]|nr:multi-sensor hybrid histidine kinase [Verrucomicrobiota bacterium]
MPSATLARVQPVMVTLPPPPRRTWLELTSLVLAGALILLGGGSLLGWWMHLDNLVQPLVALAPITANEALCVFLLGGALLGLERKWFPPAWCALPAIVLTALTVGEYAFSADFRIDELLVRDHLLVDIAFPGRMSIAAASSLLLVAVAFVWRSINRVARTQAFIGGVAGSIVAAVGCSTLLGYAANVPAVYGWGTATAISPVSGFALLLLGLALLVLSWREAVQAEGDTPSWSPVPVVTACLTLSVILWIGLRAREHGYIGAKTQTSMEGVATTINYELERQKSFIERLASDWGNAPENATAVWDSDARLRMDELTQFGCVSLAWVGPNLRTTWVYPLKDNEGAFNYDHRQDEERLNALNKAKNEKATVVSATADVGGRGKGFIIYAPVVRGGRLAGYVAAEFLYRPFFAAIIGQRKLAGEYHIAISIGSERLFDSSVTGSIRNGDLTLDRAYAISDRRIRLSFTPSDAALASDRRLLPELALIAGLGITLLLGLSIHLARRSRAGQRAAEFSNLRLVAENEERRRIEDRLKVSDERLRLALDSTQIGIFEWNILAGHVYYSPGLWAMLGYEHQRMPATVEAWQSLIHADDLPLYRERVASQLDGSVNFIEPDYRVRAANGEWRWVYSRAKNVVSGEDGRPSRIIGTVQDITARRETELALRESQAEARKLSLVASKTDNPVLIGSPDGIIEWVNESFCRVMEYSLADVIGRNPADFMIGPETDPRVIVKIRAAMARGQGLSTDVVNYSKSGRKYHLHLEIQPVRNEAGQLENFIAIESDITARVETEAQLRLAKAEADAASRAKSEFLASMSHEIRTPMNGVIGMTSLLMESTLTDEQRDFVNTIRVSGEALLTIINDILDFSKIESGKMDLEELPFELVSCLEETLDLFAPQAASKQIELVYFVEPGVPPWLLGDITRVRQILVNLVNNAVKFTPQGSVTIDVRPKPSPVPGAPLMIEFAVRDTGIGIPPDRVDRLFKAFSQGDSSTTRKYGGTGLGLVICQSLATLMGGEIRVESVVGRGSTFIFSIRTAAAPVPLENSPPALPEIFRAAPVLCVEDHPITRRRLKILLESLGGTPVFSNDIPAALSLAGTMPQAPSLVLAHCHANVSAAIMTPLLALKVPTILMLPFGQTPPVPATDEHPYLVVHKPLKTSTLLHAFSLLGNPGSQRSNSQGISSASGMLLAHEFPLNLLLAEDNTVNQKVALRFLDRLGYRADAVSNGLEVITALGTRHYDVVLMDLQMPEMDGLEASRQIRRLLPPDRQPKIIALTANAMQGDRELCLAAGMDDYISKPVKLHEIAAAIRRLFAKPVEVDR